MSALHALARWFVDDPIRGAGLIFSVTIAGVVLYTFLMSSVDTE